MTIDQFKGFDLSISTYGALGYHVSDHIYNALNSCYGYGNKEVTIDHSGHGRGVDTGEHQL